MRSAAEMTSDEINTLAVLVCGYTDLVIKHGHESQQARQFEEANKQNADFMEYTPAVRDMHQRLRIKATDRK
jgi:hypothetical protein